MSGKEQTQAGGHWYSVIDGKLRRKVEKDTPGAVMREWKVKDKSGVKYEILYNALFGTIQNIEIRDGEYGQQIVIELDEDDDGNKPLIGLSVKSRYGADFLKKLPNIKLDQEVRLMPFQFEDDNGKERIGLSVAHKDENDKFNVKVENFFGKDSNVSGFPNPSEDAKEKWTSDDWQNYFGYQLPKFLVKYAEENILSKFHVEPAKVDYPEEKSIDPDAIPFN